MAVGSLVFADSKGEPMRKIDFTRMFSRSAWVTARWLLHSTCTATFWAPSAGGAAEARKIVHSTLLDSYLRYLWIDTLNENPDAIYVATEANLPITGNSGEKFQQWAIRSRPTRDRPSSLHRK